MEGNQSARFADVPDLAHARPAVRPDLYRIDGSYQEGAIPYPELTLINGSFILAQTANWYGARGKLARHFQVTYAQEVIGSDLEVMQITDPRDGVRST